MPGRGDTGSGFQARSIGAVSIQAAEVKNKEAQSKARYLCNYIEEAESEIATLQNQNAHLKEMLISARRSRLEKFFTVIDHVMKHTVLFEWKRCRELLRCERLIEQADRQRNEEHVQFLNTVQGLDRALLLAQQDKQRLTEQIAEAQLRLEMKTREIEEESQREEGLREVMAQADGLLGSLRERLNLYEPATVQEEVPQRSALSTLSDALQEVLHGLDPTEESREGAPVVVKYWAQQPTPPPAPAKPAIPSQQQPQPAQTLVQLGNRLQPQVMSSVRPPVPSLRTKSQPGCSF